ncbi:rhomboid family intramembrane serine protease [bacterium]|nr:rhomboid family intramembrane serine protease [bacterium]MCI0605539.1 rhomboid family intramembrane serine protease [bacterium]
MKEELRPEIVETYLSRPPRKNCGIFSLAVIAVTFLFSLIYWGNSFGLRKWLNVDRDAVFVSHEYWRLLTGILVHADTNHFFSNALGLFLFGYLLNGYFGPTVYPMGVFVLGIVVNLVSIATYPPGTGLVGASGVVYLMAGFWLTLFVSTERRFSILQRLLRSIGFALVMLISSTFDPAISHRTHAIGFFTGIVYGLIYFFKAKEKIRAAEVVALE